MGMTRSDLPRVSRLAPDVQRRAVDAMWQAYAAAEQRDEFAIPGSPCPVSRVATFAAVLEAALEALDRPLRWRTDIDGGEAGTEPARTDDEHALEWTPCGEPDAHAAHRWHRAGWARWRFCTGRALSDREFLAMHPLDLPHAFVTATPPLSEPELARRLEGELLAGITLTAGDAVTFTETRDQDGTLLDRSDPVVTRRCRDTAEHAAHRWGSLHGEPHVPPGLAADAPVDAWCPGRTAEEAGRAGCPTDGCHGLDGLLGWQHSRGCRFYLGRRDDAPVIP